MGVTTPKLPCTPPTPAPREIDPLAALETRLGVRTRGLSRRLRCRESHTSVAERAAPVDCAAAPRYGGGARYQAHNGVGSGGDASPPARSTSYFYHGKFETTAGQAQTPLPLSLSGPTSAGPSHGSSREREGRAERNDSSKVDVVNHSQRFGLPTADQMRIERI